MRQRFSSDREAWLSRGMHCSNKMFGIDTDWVSQAHFAAFKGQHTHEDERILLTQDYRNKTANPAQLQPDFQHVLGIMFAVMRLWYDSFYLIFIISH